MPYVALHIQTVFFREGTNRLRDTKARGLLTHDTTRPLKQGSLALSSEISSFTTLQKGEEAVRAGFRTSEEKETFSDEYLHTTPGSPGLETEKERTGSSLLLPGHRFLCPQP